MSDVYNIAMSILANYGKHRCLTPLMLEALREVEVRTIVKSYSLAYLMGDRVPPRWNAQRTLQSLQRRLLVVEVEYDLARYTGRARQPDYPFSAEKSLRGYTVTHLGDVLLHHAQKIRTGYEGKRGSR